MGFSKESCVYSHTTNSYVYKGNLTLSSETKIDFNLKVDGDVLFEKNVHLKGNLTVIGNLLAKGNFYAISSHIYVEKTAIFYGETQIGSLSAKMYIRFRGEIRIADYIKTESTIISDGKLFVGLNLTATDLHAKTLSVGSYICVTNKIEISRWLEGMLKLNLKLCKYDIYVDDENIKIGCCKATTEEWCERFENGWYMETQPSSEEYQKIVAAFHVAKAFQEHSLPFIFNL